jgi:hypothetical protein
MVENENGDGLERAAELCERAAEELNEAAKHCRTAADHFRDREVPRGAAHAWAAYGHIRTAEDALDEQARRHSQASRPL